jgi:hypothetical protein
MVALAAEEMVVRHNIAVEVVVAISHVLQTLTQSARDIRFILPGFAQTAHRLKCRKTWCRKVFDNFFQKTVDIIRSDDIISLVNDNHYYLRNS